MSSAWDEASELAKKHAAGGIFVRLANNGDKVVGAYCGEPFARELVWTGSGYEPWDPHKHVDKRPSLRVMLNFYVPAERAMKVIEGGTLWFKDVLKLRAKYGLADWLFEIERLGEAGDPKTRFSILPETRIDEETRALIAAAKLHDLEAVAQGEAAAGGGSGAAPRASGSGTVSPQVSGEIVARLKALSADDVTAFLGRFGIQRVRDLGAADEEAARAALAELEGKGARSAEVDPFA